MRLGVATVITARPWEQELVAGGRASGAIRVVARVYRPEDVPLHETDVIVLGDETAWLSEHVVSLWLAADASVVIVSDATGVPLDLPGVAVAQPAFDEIVGAIQKVHFEARPSPPIVSVVGASGSGVTEVACALATILREARLIHPNSDEASLRLGFRHGHSSATIEVDDCLPAAAGRPVVIAAGHRLDLISGRPILMVADTPTGYVRASSLITKWGAEIPTVVCNLVLDRARAIRMTTMAIGLEPDLVLPYDPAIRAASIRGDAPPDWFIRSVGTLLGRASPRGSTLS